MDQLASTLFIFTSTPAGLGHIRVMDAIKDNRPTNITAIELGVLDIKANRIHDLGSRVKAFVKLTQFYQTNPIAENLVTSIYTHYLERHTQKIENDFENIAKKYPNFKTWVVISTHFALAYPIAAAKPVLEKKYNIKIRLCVVVTDDSPQRVWAIKGADLIFVPSTLTRDRLALFLPLEKRDIIKPISFPVSPRLSQNLNLNEFQFILDQLNPQKPIPTQIVIPISGAAVQLKFFQTLMENLGQGNFQFTVIGQESFLTQDFFQKIVRLPRVQLSIGADARQTVNFYESLFYQPNRPSIEITKPSEQTFKAILNPRQRGGVILLLTQPIGRQEFDNLNFLVRNGLMPTPEENAMLFRIDLMKIKEQVKNWRAIRLPDDPRQAAQFIKNLKSSGVLYSMLNAVIKDKPELKDTGVHLIWEEIKKLIIT